MNRSNDNWIKHLRDGSIAQSDALYDLRELLIAGLRKSFYGHEGAGSGLLEDAVQESLLKILNHLDRFEGKSRFTTWAMTIAVRQAFTELRKRHWKDVSLDQVLEGVGCVSKSASGTTPGPEQAAQQKSLIEMMYQIIDTDLSKKQRDALLAELQGMPQEEIGRRMGSNRNAVYKLTHDARKRLKAGLEASGYTLADIQAVFGS